MIKWFWKMRARYWFHRWLKVCLKLSKGGSIQVNWIQRRCVYRARMDECAKKAGIKQIGRFMVGVE